jgi:penicillin-binding protein A
MNAPIARLFVVVVVLFAVLVGFTSRWTVFQADALRDNPRNRRELLEEQKIRRGLIRAADDTVLARSLKQADDSYVRTYPPGRLFSHAVGYSFVRQGRAGLERYYDDDLSGRNSELGSLVDRLSGSEQAPSSRSTRRPGRSGSWRRSPATTPTRSRTRHGSAR